MAILVGAGIVVEVLRRTVAVAEEQRERARWETARRIAADEVLERSVTRVGATEREAADLLAAIAEGRVSCQDPDVVVRGGRLAEALRVQARALSGPAARGSLLGSVPVAEGFRLRVTDPDLARRLPREERTALLAAVRSIAAAPAAGALTVSVRPLPTPDLVHVVLNRTGGPPPPDAAAGWRRLREQPHARFTVRDDGWLYDARFPVREHGEDDG